MSVSKRYIFGECQKGILPIDLIEGYTHLLEPGELGVKNLHFGILKLAQNSTFFDHTGPCEAVLIALGGECRLLVGHNGNKANGILGARPDVFQGEACIAYIPHLTTYEVITDKNNIELAICKTPSHLDTAAVILDEGVPEIQPDYQLQVIENDWTSEWVGEAICFNRFQNENGSATLQLMDKNKKKARIVLYNNELLVLPEKTRARLLAYQGTYYQLTIARSTRLQ